MNFKNRYGNVLLAALVLLMVGVFIAAMLGSQAVNWNKLFRAETEIDETKGFSDQYVENDNAINEVFNELRTHSQAWASLFTKSTFESNYEIQDNPFVGYNDQQTFKNKENQTVAVSDLIIASKVRVRSKGDTRYTPVFTSDGTLGLNYLFPRATYFDDDDDDPNDDDDDDSSGPNNDGTLSNVLTGETTEINELFSNLLSTRTKSRITMIDAKLGEDNYYQPVFRIDSRTSDRAGLQLYGIIQGQMVTRFDAGIYGEDSLVSNANCLSYNSDVSTSLDDVSTCLVASISDSNINVGGDIGTLRSLSQNSGAAAIAGESCVGVECQSDLFSHFPAFSEKCPTPAAAPAPDIYDNYQLSSNSGLTCWDPFTVNAGNTVTLTGTGDPIATKFNFKGLNFASTSSKLEVRPTLIGGVPQIISVWVDTLPSQVLASQFVYNLIGTESITNYKKPYRFRIYYTGSNPITLGLDVDSHFVFVAPNSSLVTVTGGAKLYGAVLAKNTLVQLTGLGQIIYDRAIRTYRGNGDDNTPVDMYFEKISVGEEFQEGQYIAAPSPVAPSVIPTPSVCSCVGLFNPENENFPFCCGGTCSDECCDNAQCGSGETCCDVQVQATPQIMQKLCVASNMCVVGTPTPSVSESEEPSTSESESPSIEPSASASASPSSTYIPPCSDDGDCLGGKCCAGWCIGNDQKCCSDTGAEYSCSTDDECCEGECAPTGKCCPGGPGGASVCNGSQMCCAGTCMQDGDTGECCDKDTGPHCWNPEKCCGTSGCYDEAQDECCDDRNHTCDKFFDECCGAGCISKMNEKCCDKTNGCPNAQTCCGPTCCPAGQDGCCGGQCYQTGGTKSCCGGAILDTANTAERCCNGQARYDPANQQCCPDGQIKGQTESCTCGNGICEEDCESCPADCGPCYS